MFHWFEQRPFFFAVMVFIFVSFAGVIESNSRFCKTKQDQQLVQNLTLLELTGRHVYIKDSCNACHSQLVRPFKSETDRYGMYSLSGEYAYDRPFYGIKKNWSRLNESWKLQNYRLA